MNKRAPRGRGEIARREARFWAAAVLVVSVWLFVAWCRAKGGA